MSSKYRIIPFGGGGGITPTGTLDIRSEGVFDVTDYASVDVDIFDDTTTKTITDNGVYNASDDNVLGYSQVTVAVPASAVDTGTLTLPAITQNVTLFTQDVTGYRAVAFPVAVPASEVDTGTKQITANGNGQDVVGYAAVDVNVPNGTETIQITQNGTYTPTSPNIGFSEVTVDVGAPVEPGYFRATSIDGETTVSLKKYSSSQSDFPVIYKSSDKTNWTLWDGSPITLQRDETVYFYGNNPTGFSKSSSVYFAFGAGEYYDSNKVRFSGNIMTLLTRLGDMSYIPAYSFYHLFDFINNTGVAYPDDRTRKRFDNLSITATGVFEYGCAGMFKGCTGLTSAPNFAPYSISDSSLYEMFHGCSALTDSPDLHNITSVQRYGMASMFYGCSALVTAPDISSISSVGEYGLRQMFSSCSSLVTAPDLSSIKNVGQYGMASMFYNCSSLEHGPSLLDISQVQQYGMTSMFERCTSLTTAPAINMRYGSGTYSMQRMFYGCTSLTTPPAISGFSTLTDRVMDSMFYGCTSLEYGPDLSSIKTANNYSMYEMFRGCTSLTRVIAPSFNVWNTSVTLSWLDGVAQTGTIVTPTTVTIPTGTSGIPSGWTKLSPPSVTIDYTNMTATVTSDYAGADLYYSTNETDLESQFTLYSGPIQIPAGSDYYIVRAYAKAGTLNSFITTAEYGDYFYIEANGDGSVTISLSNNYPLYAKDNTLISTDRNNWSAVTNVTLNNAGDRVYYKRKTNSTSTPKFGVFGGTFSVSGSGTVSAGGRLSSIAYPTTKPNQEIGDNNAFKQMFYNCTKITDAENIKFDLKQTNNNYENTYKEMFYGCTNLVKAPATMPDYAWRYCYDYMFYNCSSLTQPPVLPATVVSSYAYNYMFNACTALTQSPDLPAPNPSGYSYSMMFYRCTSLTKIVCYATNWNTYTSSGWLYGASATGDFYNLGGATIPTGTDGIPSGWTEHTTL